MKTLIVLISLFAAQMSFAIPADTICRTKYMGYNQHQISVFLIHKATHAEATVVMSSNDGKYRPIYFKNLQVYGMNGATSYVSQDPSMSRTPKFALTIHSSSKGFLSMGDSTYPVACVSALDPVVAL